MYRNTTISVVIPCYNEAKRLPSVLREIPKFVDEVIVVDNNSTDDTNNVARENNTKVVFEKQKGYGNAYKTGFLHASKDIIFALDGDGAFSPKYISVLMDIMLSENLDFIWGNRFFPGNKSKMRMPNYIGNKILTLTMSLLYGKKVSDSQSGLWLFKRSLLSELYLISNGMSFSQEIKIAVICNKSIRYKEIPVNCRTNAKKKNIIALFYEGIKNLIFLFTHYRKFNVKFSGHFISKTEKSLAQLSS